MTYLLNLYDDVIVILNENFCIHSLGIHEKWFCLKNLGVVLVLTWTVISIAARRETLGNHLKLSQKFILDLAGKLCLVMHKTWQGSWSVGLQLIKYWGSC